MAIWTRAGRRLARARRFQPVASIASLMIDVAMSGFPSARRRSASPALGCAQTRQAISEDMRDGDTFAAAVDPPEDASPLDQLVAFTGRQV